MKKLGFRRMEILSSRRETKYLKNLKKSNISGHVNYKNILLLRHYITVSGKIIPKRLNHLTTKRQRYITKAIKNARLMSFLPFVRFSSY